MTQLKGDVFIGVGIHRLYPYFDNLLILVSAVCRSIKLIANVGPIYAPGGSAYFSSKQFDVSVFLPIYGPIEHALEGKRAHVIQVRITPLVQAKEGPNTIPLGPWGVIFANTVSPTFVQFYEDNVSWLKSNTSSDPQKWPSIWNFARVIRNAISHGGLINIDNPNAPIATWHHISYGPAQNHLKVIGTEFFLADLMILMLEMADELNRLNCPMPFMAVVDGDGNRLS